MYINTCNIHTCVGQWNADFSGFWFQEILKIILRDKLENDVYERGASSYTPSYTHT